MTVRVVVDTNVAISKLISPDGVAAKAFDHAFMACAVLISPETVAELSEKLSSPKFDRYASDEQRSALLDFVTDNAELVATTSEATLSIDPDDNMFLALAVDGRADCIVSGDKKHLLVLGSYESIPIMSPAAFLERYR